jgi:hypothetical protein
VSGRFEQLGRQIRRLRSSAADQGRTLQRALHLAVDLAGEHDAEDFGALAARGLLDGEVAARLGALVGKLLADHDVTADAIADLDVFLRSIEAGAPVPRLLLPPIGAAPKLPPGTKKTAINVSGRVLTLVGRDGRAFVLCDDRPIGQPFDLSNVPVREHQVSRERDGTVRIEWPDELRLVVAPDFASVRPELI